MTHILTCIDISHVFSATIEAQCWTRTWIDDVRSVLAPAATADLSHLTHLLNQLRIRYRAGASPNPDHSEIVKLLTYQHQQRLAAAAAAIKAMQEEERSVEGRSGSRGGSDVLVVRQQSVVSACHVYIAPSLV